MLRFPRLLGGLIASLVVFAAGRRAAPAAEPPAPTPFGWDWSRAAESVIDLSGFLDAPAGRHGFVRAEAGHLVDGRGRRVRFWGVNIAGPSCFPPKDQAPLIAADLARLGINAVRFHHLDADWGRCLFVNGSLDTQQFDAGNLDRLDFFVAELKRRGIYANLNLNVHRWFRAGDGVRDFTLLGIGKAATYFDPRLIELQQAHARRLLTHRNPYLGTEYREEPAIVTVEIVNENSLLEAWQGWRLVGNDGKSGDTWSPLPVSYDRELTTQWNAWLATNRSLVAVAALRQEAGVPASAAIPRLRPDEFATASVPRFRTEAEFYLAVEAAFFNGMRRLLKEELGVRSMIVGSADHNDGFAGYAHVLGLLNLDVVDGHGYWEHPDIGKVTKIKNTPMVNDPLDSTFVQLARTPVAGRPFTVSEVNHPFPHRFAAEGYLTLTAYALFHDWDAIYWFDWERGRLEDPKNGIPRSGWFDVSVDPVKLAQLTVAALMWHRQDVTRARRTVQRGLSREQIIDALRMDKRERPFFQPGFDRGTPLQHRTVWSPEGKSDAFPPPADRDRLVSDTGQLRWLHAGAQRGLVLVDTPRAQAMIGFVRGSQDATTHLAADLENEFVALSLVSLDDREIAHAQRLLLVATTGAARNTGQQFGEDGRTLVEWGRGPVLIDPVSGGVTVRGLTDARQVRVQPLTAEGRAVAPARPAIRDGAAWRVDLGTPAATMAIVEVER